MILSGLKMKEEINNKNICIKPFDDNLLNPNSYNYRLGSELLEIDDELIDVKKKRDLRK